jgi:hypothetical protein
MAKCSPIVFDNYNQTEEDNVAKIFCDLANKYFENINGNIYALPSLKTERELDLVVWMEFPKYKPRIKTAYKIIDAETGASQTNKFRSNKDVWFNSALLIIELKKHNTTDSISIRNGEISVKQIDGFHNASNQSFNQVHPLKNYLIQKLNISEKEVPRITNLIWLYRWGQVKPDGYEEVENLILGEWNFDSILEQLCKLNPPVEYSNNPGNYQYGGIKKDIIDKMNCFFEDRLKEKAIGIGKISRTKLNKIISKDIDVEGSSCFKSLGKQLIILKGNPGTGKTIYLIHLAYHSKDNEFTPLVLTFNKALSQDIDRLMEYSGLGKSIQINTLHHFFIRLLINNQLLSENDFDIFKENNYIELLNQLFDLINEIPTSIQLRKDLGIKFDLIFIDEAQDCEEIEKKLLFKIFGINNCIISIGSRQIVRRNREEINWAFETIPEQRTVFKLKISHRNKKDLTDWFNAFSNSHFNRKPWELKENKHLNGGKLILLKTSEYGKAFHLQLDNSLVENENSKYDLMYLTPNKSENTDYGISLSEKLTVWGFNNFNYNNQENKNKKFPIDAHRILNYQSCRGLEAWTLVVWNLDIIIQNIKTKFIFDFPEANQNEITENINNWLLMIFTRAIDTLVITIDNVESEEYKLIVDLAKSKKFGHMAEIRE